MITRAKVSGIAISAIVVAMVASTHCLAWHLGAQKALGSPIYIHEITNTFHVPIYLPWMIIVWFARWGMRVPFMQQAITAGACSAFALIAVCIYGHLQKGKSRDTDRHFGKDAWGTTADLVKAKLLPAELSGTVLGTWENKLIAYNGDEHQLITGGPGSGKTHGPLISSLLTCKSSALIIDPKRSLWENTAECRSALGDAVYFDPTDPESICINPLDEVTQISHAQNIANIAVKSSGLNNSDPIWPIKATDLITGLILYTIHHLEPSERTLSRVRTLIGDETSYDEMSTSQHPEVKRTGIAMTTTDSRIADSVAVTADAALSVFADELVAKKTSRSDIRISDLMCSDRPMSLYLQVRASESQRLKPLQRIILSQVKKAALYDLHVMPDGRRKTNRLTLFLEEFPAMGKDEEFEYELRQMREYGLTAVMCCQSILDIESIYGTHQTILDNCKIIVCFAASNPKSLKDISTLLGRAYEIKTSETRPKSAFSGMFSGNRSISTQLRQLMDEGEIRRMAADEELIFVTNSPPFKAKKVFWFDHSLLKDRGTNMRKGGVAPRQNQKYVDPAPDEDDVVQMFPKVNNDITDRVSSVISRNGWSKSQAASILFPDTGNSLARHWISGTRTIPSAEIAKLEHILESHEQ